MVYLSQRFVPGLPESVISSKRVGRQVFAAEDSSLSFSQLGQKRFHAQWLIHGSETILGEVASERGLFEMTDCDSHDVSCIYQRCRVLTLEDGQHEPDDKDFIAANEFYSYGYEYLYCFSDLCSCHQRRLIWNKEACSFTDPPMTDYASAKEHPTYAVYPCLSCSLSALQDDHNSFHLYDDSQPNLGFTFANGGYHLGDFVYVAPAAGFGRYHIGQIMDVDASPSLSIAVLEYGDRGLTDVPRSLEWAAEVRLHCSTCIVILIYKQRLLMSTDVVKSLDPSRIEGKCFVRPLAPSNEVDEDWILGDGHYYLLTDNEFYHCDKCLEIHEERFKDAISYQQENERLSCMELFSGRLSMSAYARFAH
jgi:DNA (cytosine-5)-methyltransferase 1